MIDTGPIVAILSESDEHHDACVEQLHDLRSPLWTCWPVVTEAAWLLRAYPQAIARLLSSFGGQPLQLISLDESDLPGIAAILAKYQSLGIQLADAALDIWRTVKRLTPCSLWTGAISGRFAWLAAEGFA